MFKLTATLLLLGRAATTCFGQTTPYPPKVVVNVALTAQGGAIPSTPVLTFKTKLYRINMYYENFAKTADCGTSISPQFQWIDDTKATRTTSFSPVECDSWGYREQSFIIRGVPGTALMYSVLANPQDTIQYDLYITVEQLQ